MDAGTLANIASVISAFGAAMLFFRIQRENDMRQKGEIVWLPFADWLLVAATALCLLLVIVPLVSSANLRLPAAAAGSAAFLVAGYIPAIMAHYRIVFDRKREGPRHNPEPTERILVWGTGAVALLFFLWRLLPSSN
jgi:hypothetical protein